MSENQFVVCTIPIEREIGDTVLKWSVPIYVSEFEKFSCKFYANFDNGYVTLVARNLDEMEHKIRQEIEIYLLNSSRFSHASTSD
jgi:hypothetical protein